VTLSSFRGKQNVLLAFFPLAFTGTCTKELICFTEDFDQFAGRAHGADFTRSKPETAR